jgi:hypothetical protein
LSLLLLISTQRRRASTSTSKDFKIHPPLSSKEANSRSLEERVHASIVLGLRNSYDKMMRKIRKYPRI